MFNKLLVASVVLAASTGAFAANYKGDYKGEAAPVCPSCTYTYQAAPYVGVGLGNFVTYSGRGAVQNAISGNINAGYAAMINPMFYLAGEALIEGDANVKNYTRVSTTAAASASARSNWGYGLSIIPGYMVTDHVLGFARLGAVRSRFNDQGVWSTGWQVGLGLQTNVYQNWDMRAEYDYTNYNRVNGSNNGGIGKPQRNQAVLGLIYKFL